MVTQVGKVQRSYDAQQQIDIRPATTFRDRLIATSPVSSQKNRISIAPAYADFNSLLTEAGRNSEGDETLTDTQLLALRNKYNISTLSSRKSTELLAELTNLGVLSYCDYKYSNVCVMALGPHGESCGYTKDTFDSAYSNTYVIHLREQMVMADAVRKANLKIGKKSSPEVDATDAAHEHVYALLEKLDPVTCIRISNSVKALPPKDWNLSDAELE